MTHTLPCGEQIFTTIYSIALKGENVNMEFGKILKEERTKRGISQKKLAEAAGVTARAIIYWENGQRQMNIENADKLFKALHTSIKIGE